MDDPKFVGDWCIQHREEIGTLHLLIHNAGLSMRELFMNTEIELGQRLLDVDFLSIFTMTKELMPIMNTKDDGSVICGVGSLAGVVGPGVRSYYGGVKAAMDGFFKSLNCETKPNNVHSMVIHLGYIKTNVSINALVGDGSSAFGKMDKNIEQGIKVRDCCNLMIDGINNRQVEVWICNTLFLKVLIYVGRLFKIIADKMIHKNVQEQLEAMKNSK